MHIMFRKITICCVLLVVVCTHLFPQSTITVEDVKVQFINKPQKASELRLDILGNELRLDCENLHKTRMSHLPTSKWLLMYEVEPGKFNAQTVFRQDLINKGICPILCWVGTLENSSDEETKKILSKEYGTIKSEDGKYDVIPAKWLNDTICVLNGIANYGGFWVYEYIDYYKFENGMYVDEIQDTETLYSDFKNEFYYKQSPYGRLANIVANISPNLYTQLGGDGANLKKMSDYRMLLLSYELYKYCCEHPLPENEQRRCEYGLDETIPVYIWMDQGGSCYMEILREKPFPVDYQPRITQLLEAVHNLPKGIIDVRRTVDKKILPGQFFNIKIGKYAVSFSEKYPEFND